MADRKALCLTSAGLAEIAPEDRLILPGDPDFGLHAVTKQYIDRLLPYIPFSGNSFFANGGVETGHRLNQSQLPGTSGRLWLSYFTAIVDIPVTRLGMGTSNSVASGTTLSRLALFTVASDDSVTMVARTDSDNNIGLGTYTYYERLLSTVGGFPTSYNLLAGTRYARGYLHIATTMCSIGGFNFSYEAQSPVASRKIDGQTDIAASYAVANIPVWYQSAWQTARP